MKNTKIIETYFLWGGESIQRGFSIFVGNAFERNPVEQ